MELNSQAVERLVGTARAFIELRFAGKEISGAAAMYTEDGQILISTAPEAVHPGARLCHETGAMFEAFKLNKRVIATVCVFKGADSAFRIVAPCGICQERLMVYGEEVIAAVPLEDDSSKFLLKSLRELQPFYWRRQFLR
jgi:cytidine deaminase